MEWLVNMELPPGYLIVRTDNQSNISLIGSANNHHSNGDLLNNPVLPDSNDSNNRVSQANLITLIQNHLKYWIDCLGVQSAEAQNLKEPITCHTRFIQGSFRGNSPHKHRDIIYFLVAVNPPQSSPTNNATNHNTQLTNQEIKLTAIGFIRIGYRNLFLQRNEKLVNVQRCFSILDFYLTQQRQGFGKILLSHVLSDQSQVIGKCAFDRPTSAMLSFLCKHFNLGPPRKQHNRFVIYDNFFA